MSFRPPIFIIYTIIILIHLSTSTYSSPLIEQEDVGPLTEQGEVGPPLIEQEDVYPFIRREDNPLIEQDILDPVIIEHDDSLIEQDTGRSYCQSGTSLFCCPYLAHRVSSRHASIVLDNRSGRKITLEAVSLKHGRWVTSKDYDGIIDINCEPQTEPLENGSSTVFSSVKSRFLGEVQGFATFSLDDGDTFTVSWKISTFGFSHYSIEGLSEEKYQITEQNDHMVHRFVINERTFPFSFWFLPPLFLIIPCCCTCPNPNDSSRERLNRDVRDYGGMGNGNFTNHRDACDISRASVHVPAHMYHDIPNPNPRVPAHMYHDPNPRVPTHMYHDPNLRIPAHMHHGRMYYDVPNPTPTHMYHGVSNPGVPTKHWNGDKNQ